VEFVLQRAFGMGLIPIDRPQKAAWALNKEIKKMTQTSEPRNKIGNKIRNTVGDQAQPSAGSIHQR